MKARLILFSLIIFLGFSFSKTLAATMLTWSGPTSGSQDITTNTTLVLTVPGVYAITVSGNVVMSFGGSAGGGGGGSACASGEYRGSGAYGNGADGGGGGASTGSVLMSATLYPTKNYQLGIGVGGLGGSGGSDGGSGGETYLYNITDGVYLVRLQGGGNPWGGGIYVGTGVGGAQGGAGGWIYENGWPGGSQPTGAGGGGGSGGSCDWGVAGSGGGGASGGSGVSGPGSSGGGGAVSCYNQTAGGGGGGWWYTGLPNYYGGGGGGAGACGYYGVAGNGGPGAFVFKGPAGPIKYRVTATKSTGGRVKSSDNLIDCGTGSSCYYDYVQGSNVTLKAYPSSTYWKFNGWSGDCTGTGSCVLRNLSSVKNVRASFGLRLFRYIEL